MIANTNKIKLSPRLRWGVGRDNSKINFFKVTGSIFLVISSVLVIRATYLLFSDNESTQANPQVLGAVDTPAENTFREYKVKKGDTLFTISKEYNVDWTTLATINNLKPPFALSVGQTVKIPQN